MRQFVLASIAVFSIVFPTIADNLPTFSRPATEQYLRQLDNDQLRIVRRAVRSCPLISKGSSVIRPERNPCVISSTDNAIADSQDEDLQAFHDALRPSDRYDETRTSAAWMIWRFNN